MRVALVVVALLAEAWMGVRAYDHAIGEAIKAQLTIHLLQVQVDNLQARVDAMQDSARR